MRDTDVDEAAGWEIQLGDGCDAHKDCTDGSDETFVECYREICPNYKCSYGGCYKKSQRCDGKLDCWDGTDEHPSLCSRNQSEVHPTDNDSTLGCPENHVKCKSSSDCLDVKFVCDGIKDCQDGSDETSGDCLISKCPNDTFRCAYGGCLANNKTCDGEMNCWDKSDEEPVICTEIGKKYEFASLKVTTKVTGRTTSMFLTKEEDVARMNYAKSSACKIPGNLKNLQVKTLFNVLPYKVGAEISDSTVVRLSCSENTGLYGSDLNQCLNGNWQGPWPDCIAKCRADTLTRDPSIQATCRYNGDIQDCEHNLFIGTTANVTCAPSYKPKNSISWQVRTCTEVSVPNHRFGLSRTPKVVSSAFPNVA
ncbi:LOW QUALITY PROTEIN: modular serine protease [Drosophila ficusphila]|uniref:LOW QUALITY PROTEIN: modular serine protease n=1 Tax=Drosophila ficusphila TaxID=30025 RepID=UPI001C8A6581|nr:LOW QUALITY PROTEIN: modular serine protease [Drosophila ficusphila]